MALDPGAALAWRDGACVLDARGPDAFALGHLADAGRMTPAEFGTRRPELPPRTTRVLVVHASAGEARAAAESLAALGYGHVAWLDAPIASLPGGLADRGPAARLWRPSPFLERVTDRLARGRALDVASGAGRESVHLAAHGWSVEAWDHDPEALRRAHALADSSGVTIASRVIELEQPGELPEPAPWDTIVVCRYLNRLLLPWLERALAPGGTLVYETFRQGQEVHGHPRQARYLLEPGELARAFPSLVVECHEESDAPGGPVMAHLLARRPGAAARG